MQTCRAVCGSAGAAGSFGKVTYPKQTCLFYETLGSGKSRAVPMSKNSSDLPCSREAIVPNLFLFDGQSVIVTERVNVSRLFY